MFFVHFFEDVFCEEAFTRNTKRAIRQLDCPIQACSEIWLRKMVANWEQVP